MIRKRTLARRGVAAAVVAAVLSVSFTATADAADRPAPPPDSTAQPKGALAVEDEVLAASSAVVELPEGFESGLNAYPNGAVSVLESLGAISPAAGSKMLQISTGPGALPLTGQGQYTESSGVGKSLTLPQEGTVTLSYQWNMVSSEWGPDEYPEEGFTDEFGVYLLRDGTQAVWDYTQVDQFAITSDAGFTEVAATLPEGDTTVGQTGWRTTSITLTAEQQQQTKAIEFDIYDVGDGALTSALLVDEIDFTVDCGSGVVLTAQNVNELVDRIGAVYTDYSLPQVSEFTEQAQDDARRHPCDYVPTASEPTDYAGLPDPDLVAGPGGPAAQASLLTQFVVPSIDQAGRRIGLGIGIGENGGQLQAYAVVRLYGTSGEPKPTYEVLYSAYPVLNRTGVTTSTSGTDSVNASELAAQYNTTFPGGTIVSGYAGTFRKKGAFALQFAGAAGSFGNASGRVGGQYTEFPNPGPTVRAAPSPFSIVQATAAYNEGTPLRDAGVPWLTPVLSGSSTITVPLSEPPGAMVNLLNQIKQAAGVQSGVTPTAEQARQMANVLGAELEASPATLSALKERAWEAAGALVKQSQASPQIQWPSLSDVLAGGAAALAFVGRALWFLLKWLFEGTPAFS